MTEILGSHSPCRRRFTAWCLLPLALVLTACKVQYTTTFYEDDTYSLLMVVDMGALGPLASGDTDPCLTNSTSNGLPEGFTSYRNIGTASSPICEFRSDRAPLAGGSLQAEKKGDELHFTIPATDIDNNPDVQLLRSAGMELSFAVVFPGPVASSSIGNVSDNKVIINSLEDFKQGGTIVASAKGQSNGADQPHSAKELGSSPTPTAPSQTPSPTPTATRPAPSPPDTPTAVATPAPEVSPSAQAAPTQPADKKDNTTLYAVLGAIAAAAVLGIILVLLLQQQRPGDYPTYPRRG